MSTAVADNDILYKGAWYGLLPELLSAIPCVVEQTMVLGQARFVVGKRIERQERKGVAGAAEALQRFLNLVDALSVVEPTRDEQLLAADIENAAQLQGLPVDAGESLLSAVVLRRGLEKFATGDKRAVAALEQLILAQADVEGLAGRLVCLEQLFLRLLSGIDPGAVRRAVCQCRDVDRALSICFGCASPELAPEKSAEGLSSYIGALRAEAPRLLAP